MNVEPDTFDNNDQDQFEKVVRESGMKIIRCIRQPAFN